MARTNATKRPYAKKNSAKCPHRNSVPLAVLIIPKPGKLKSQTMLNAWECLDCDGVYVAVKRAGKTDVLAASRNA